MRLINRIILHCAATKPGMDIGRAEITKWHVDGNGWNSIGYHFVIRRDGTVETGRSLEVAGAHVAGHNSDSIGICMVGGINDAGAADTNFTRHQWKSLEGLVDSLVTRFPGVTVTGHRDYANKACPTFSAEDWWG